MRERREKWQIFARIVILLRNSRIRWSCLGWFKKCWIIKDMSHLRFLKVIGRPVKGQCVLQFESPYKFVLSTVEFSYNKHEFTKNLKSME